MTQTMHQPTEQETTGDPAPRDVLTELMELAELAEDPPEWQERALCAQTDPEAFFPEKGGSIREAKQVCDRCEVRAECLESALSHDERFGVWGGLSERERRRHKRSTPDAARVAAAQLAGLEAREPAAAPEQIRRESAPAPGGGRHAGGTGLATTPPTEPHNPRGSPRPAPTIHLPRPSPRHPPRRSRARPRPDAPVHTAQQRRRPDPAHTPPHPGHQDRSGGPDQPGEGQLRAAQRSTDPDAAAVTALHPGGPRSPTATASR